MLRTVSVDIMVRTDRLLQLVANNHTWAFGGWTTGEDQDASAGVGEGRL